MPRYHIRLFDLFGHLKGGRFIELSDDAAAQAHADKLAAEDDHSSVEVWDNDRTVYRTERRTSRPG